MGIANFMSQINYYEDVKIIKKPLKYRVKSMLKIFLIIVTIVGCFWVATKFSAALTVGNLGSLIVYGDTSVKLGGNSWYAVTLGKYDSYEEAERVALGSTIQGASGFVWEQDEMFWVVGNIYAKHDEADKVIWNMQGTNYALDILEIKFPKFKLNFDMYDNADMSLIDTAFEVFDEVYSLLYSYSIKFDKGEMSHLAVSSNISGVRGEVKSVIVGVQNLINRKNSSLMVVQEYLVSMDEVLNQAILKTIDNSATNYSLKNAVATVVRLKYEMYEKLK